MDSDSLRRLPSIHGLLSRPEVTSAIAGHGRAAVLHSLRGVIDTAREQLQMGAGVDLDPGTLSRMAIARIGGASTRLRPVINATGVLLHTGLGRAPLAAEAAEAVGRVLRGYCNLEIDLDSGLRGERTSAVADLIRELTGARMPRS